LGSRLIILFVTLDGAERLKATNRILKIRE
jgi:hypothetical protein